MTLGCRLRHRSPSLRSVMSDSLAAALGLLAVSNPAPAPAPRLDDHFEYTSASPLPAGLECGVCLRPALDPVLHSATKQLLCAPCARRDDPLDAPAETVATLNRTAVRCKECKAEMERQKFAAHWTLVHRPAVAGAAAGGADASAPVSPAVSAVAVLYKDALQAVMSLLPNVDLLRSRSVSHAWKVAAWTERRARVAKEAAMQRQIKHDVENLQDLTAMMMDESTTLEGTTRFRRILSVNASPHNEAVIQLKSDSGVSVVTKFVQLMEHKDVKIQYEAAWCQFNMQTQRAGRVNGSHAPARRFGCDQPTLRVT